MKDCIEMRMRKTGEIVRVYSIHSDGNYPTAIIYVPSLAVKQQGNGWQTVRMSLLVPPEFYVDNNSISKTQKNKIKSRLKLISAEWMCSDGTIYTHDNLESAISHEAEIINKEINNKEGE